MARLSAAALGAILIVGLVFVSISAAQEAEPRFFIHEDIMSELREGWETAGRLVGLDTTQGLGALVTTSLAPASAADKLDTPAPPQQQSLFYGFFRLLGFDSARLNAIAVNAVVFIAKMIGSSLVRKWTGGGGRALQDEVPEGSPLTWVLQDVQNKARGVLARAQSEDLADQLIAALQDVPGETDCIQVLVCRASPLLASMRRSLRAVLGAEPYPADWAALPPLRRIMHFLPSREQFLQAAGECSRRLPSCGQLFSGFDG